MADMPVLSDACLSYFRTSSSSIVTDSLWRFGIGSWMDGVLPANSASKLAGRVRTVQLSPKNGIKQSSQSFYSAAASFSAGDVLVIGTHGGRGWLLGENIAHFCLYQGLAGIVTDGKIRDLLEIRDLEFPVFSRGSTARPHQTELEVVAVDVPIECGGAYVRPGDLIVGDADGIVVAPHEIAEQLVIEAKDLVELETEQEVVIRNRGTVAEILDVSRRKKIRKGPAFVPPPPRG